MNNSKTLTDNYLEHCIQQKRLDEKTLKAYRIDLRQFFESIATPNVLDITSYTLESYIADLHMKYKPKTVKRKIASIAMSKQKDILTTKHPRKDFIIDS